MDLTSEALDELSLPDLLRTATGFMGLLETLKHIDGLDPKNLAAANLKAGVDMRAIKRLDEDLQFVAREMDGKGLITPLYSEKVRQAKRNLKQVILGVQSICKQSASPTQVSQQLAPVNFISQWLQSLDWLENTDLSTDALTAHETAADHPALAPDQESPHTASNSSDGQAFRDHLSTIDFNNDDISKDLFEQPTSTVPQDDPATAPPSDNISGVQRKLNSPQGIAVRAAHTLSNYVNATVSLLRPLQAVRGQVAAESVTHAQSKDAVRTDDTAVQGNSAPNDSERARLSPRVPSFSPITPK